MNVLKWVEQKHLNHRITLKYLEKRGKEYKGILSLFGNFSVSEMISKWKILKKQTKP